MFTRKNRVLLAALTIVVAIAVVPASAFALKAKPTGDANLDNYCQQAAALIDHALSQGDLALLDGHDDEASEWYHLAAEMIGRSQANGCQFVSGRRVRNILRNHLVVAPTQGPSGAPTTGTPPSGAGFTKPRVPAGSLVPIGGPTS
jgi:hypothetical protein